MHWTAKIALVFIYYILIGAVVTMLDMLVYYDEYCENLENMMNKLHADVRKSLDNSEFAALELCFRMFVAEVTIWPLVVLARLIDVILKGGKRS